MTYMLLFCGIFVMLSAIVMLCCREEKKGGVGKRTSIISEVPFESAAVLCLVFSREVQQRAYSISFSPFFLFWVRCSRLRVCALLFIFIFLFFLFLYRKKQFTPRWNFVLRIPSPCGYML